MINFGFGDHFNLNNIVVQIFDIVKFYLVLGLDELFKKVLYSLRASNRIERY